MNIEAEEQTSNLFLDLCVHEDGWLQLCKKDFTGRQKIDQV